MRLLLILSLTLLSTTQTVIAQEKERLWYVPSHIRTQFAGNIGMFSVGTGYTLDVPNIEIDVMYGFVPAKYAEDPLHSITLKYAWNAYQKAYENEVKMTWLKLGLWHNYSFGENYFVRLPENYENGYYYFSTALNTGLFATTELKYKKIAPYIEIGTTDKHVINFVKNVKSVGFHHLWNFGFGIKYHLK